MAKLTEREIAESLAELTGWQRLGEKIVKTLVFRDFREAVAFVNKVADLAESANHHPDIDIRWNKVTLHLTSHDAGGLTAEDFHLARKIDSLHQA